MTPELPLYLLTPSCRLYTAKEEPDLGDPWWAIFWPGGQVFFPSNFLRHPLGCSKKHFFSSKIK